jgi:hypothetical protein
MSPTHKTTNDNSLLISLASTVMVGYLSTRFRLFRRLWRFVPVLVVISAWLLNRQAQNQPYAIKA